MTCQHYWKTRLLGMDARLWQCAGSESLSDSGCEALFVEGRTWVGEQPWLPVGVVSTYDICCRDCLDGFCTSVDNSPCEKCGRSSARAVEPAR